MSNNNYNGYVECPECGSQVGVWRQKCPTCGLTLGGKLFGSLTGYTQNEIKKIFKNPEIKSIKRKAASIQSNTAAHLERNTQFQHYHTKTGHGWAAEDANALDDTLSGKKVEKIGINNELNGPDRIRNGIPIQTKYCNTPQNTINSAFDNSTNLYRYSGQKLEVPADQYEVCIELMKDKIRNGLVKDAYGNIITDPEEANNIISKGSYTYQQAQNIAKAGNIDSLLFDVKNNIISTVYVGGISLLVSFARYKWDGVDTKSALKCAVSDAIQVGGISMLTGILSSQILRTRSAAGLTILMKPSIRAIYHSSTLGKTAIEKIASVATGKSIYGAAAINNVSKLLRSNVVTSCIATTIITAPDFYRAAISQNISWAQFGKNLTVNVASVAGGVGGWAAGAAAGAAAGSVVPGIGNVIGGIIGGLIGAFGGGTLASTGAKAGLDYFIKDDAEEMIELVQDVFEQLCFDYLLSKEEVKIATSKLQNIINESWLRDMYGVGSEYRKSWAYSRLEKTFERIIKDRPYVKLPDEENFEEVIMELAEVLENDNLNNEISDEHLDKILSDLDSIDIRILQFLINNINLKDGCSIGNICEYVKISYGKMVLRLETLYNNEYIARNGYDLNYFYFINPKKLNQINYILKN